MINNIDSVYAKIKIIFNNIQRENNVLQNQLNDISHVKLRYLQCIILQLKKTFFFSGMRL